MKIKFLQIALLCGLIMCLLSLFQVNAQLAAGKDKFLGNIISNSTPSNFATYWNQVTPENAGKWGSVESTRDNMSWTSLDNAYNYAKAQGFKFKQHCFVWGAQYPSWITSLSAADQKAEVEEWIQAFAERYPNTDFIDVVNEPIKTTCPFKDALGGDGTTGWDWVVWAFQKAREYCPNAKLLINEYGTENDPTAANQYIEIINILKDQNLIDGIGIQAHYFNLDYTSASTLQSTLDKYAATGLPIYISELDIRGVSGTNTEATQLQKYQELFPVIWEHSSVVGITLWGYIEGQTWATGTGLLNSDGTERSAMIWLREYLTSTSEVSVTGVSMSPTTTTIAINGTTTLTATVTPSNATDKTVTWSSSNTDVAMVSSAGVVTGVAEGSATITVTTTDGGYTATCAVTVSESSSDCTFGTPTSSALPTISKSYSYVYVLGTGGPDLGNVTNFVINWDLANNGLYQFSMSANDGNPNWYNDLRTGATWTLSSSGPAITLSGTGFSGLDGSYYVTVYNTSDFVMVSQTGSYAIYFSNSSTTPVCTKSASEMVSSSLAESNVTLYPNPFTETVHLSLPDYEPVSRIYVIDQVGRIVLRYDQSSISSDMEIGGELTPGIYIVKVVAEQRTSTYKIIKK